MQVVNQSLDDDFAKLTAGGTRPDGVAALALEHRMHGFTFPTLSVQAIQPSLRDQIGPCSALGSAQGPVPPHGWDQIPFPDLAAIKAGIGHQFPVGLGIAPDLTAHRGQQHRILKAAIAGRHAHDQLTGRAHGLSAFEPIALGFAIAELIVGTGLIQSETRRIDPKRVFADLERLQQHLLQVPELNHPQALGRKPTRNLQP